MTRPVGITPSDIESKFREVQGQVDVVAQDSKKSAAVGGVAIAVVILLVAYVLGRRTGKRKSSVVEIRRF